MNYDIPKYISMFLGEENSGETQLGGGGHLRLVLYPLPGVVDNWDFTACKVLIFELV